MEDKTIMETNAALEYYEHVQRASKNRTKLEPPLNLHETLAAFDGHKKFGKQFIGVTVLLNVLYKQKSVQQRKVNMNEIKENPKTLKAPNKNNSSVNRVEFVPEVFKRCKSLGAKSAIAMFCLLPYKETIRKDVLFAVQQNLFDSVDEIVDLARDNIKNIRDTVKDSSKSCSDQSCINLIQALLKTSDLLRDKSFSKLAMAVHPTRYLDCLKHYQEESVYFNTICPYDALINKYLYTCIASKSKASEREKITNQFEVNKHAIVDNMVASLCEDKESSGPSVKFQESREYHTFEGPINFPRDLTYTYKQHNGKQYQIVTYKDCLYDVIGTEDELFSNKTWQERLDSIEYTAKIIIKKMTGSELNKFNGNSTLATAWMEDDRFHCKHYTFLKRGHKKAMNAS